jgi:hypothetical protein
MPPPRNAADLELRCFTAESPTELSTTDPFELQPTSCNPLEPTEQCSFPIVEACSGMKSLF